MNDKSVTARDVIGDYLVEQCTVIIDSEAQLRAGEEVVHTTRVAVRRLRSTLRVFAELFDPGEAGRLEEELVWWANLLGEVRDLDILTQRQAALLAEVPPELILGPVASTIQTELAARRKAAVDAMTDTLNSARYRKLVALIHHWRADPPFTYVADSPSDALDPAIKKAKKKARNRLATAVEVRQAGEPIPRSRTSPIHPQTPSTRLSRRRRRKRATGSRPQSRCDRPESRRMRCCIARARRRSATATR